MSVPSESYQRAVDEVQADLYRLSRDIEKYSDMLDRGKVLHPATVAFLPTSALDIHDKIIDLWLQWSGAPEISGDPGQ